MSWSSVVLGLEEERVAYLGLAVETGELRREILAFCKGLGTSASPDGHPWRAAASDD